MFPQFNSLLLHHGGTAPPGFAATLPVFDRHHNQRGSFTAGAEPAGVPSFAAGAGPPRAPLPAIEHPPMAQQNQQEPSLLEGDSLLTLLPSNPHFLELIRDAYPSNGKPSIS